MIDLKKTYKIALIFIIIGSLVYSIFFIDLLIYFLIPAVIGFINYYFLEKIQNYDKLTHLNVLGTLVLRYLVYILTAFLLIWLNKDNPNLILIGVSVAIGFAIIQVSTVINTLFNRNGVK